MTVHYISQTKDIYKETNPYYIQSWLILCWQERHKASLENQIEDLTCLKLLYAISKRENRQRLVKANVI